MLPHYAVGLIGSRTQGNARVRLLSTAILRQFLAFTLVEQAIDLVADKVGILVGQSPLQVSKGQLQQDILLPCFIPMR